MYNSYITIPINLKEVTSLICYAELVLCFVTSVDVADCGKSFNLFYFFSALLPSANLKPLPATDISITNTENLISIQLPYNSHQLNLELMLLTQLMTDYSCHD